MLLKFILLSIFFISSLWGKEDEEKTIEPPKVGNFSLPTSQQPAGLFAFGGNIIEKDEVQIFLFYDDFIGKRKRTVDVIPSLLLGLSNNLSLFFTYAFTPLLKDGSQKSRGLEDYFIQLEYAFYNQSTAYYSDQATLLANFTTPTGSVTKNPPTGYGCPSFFLGGTFYRTWVDWIAFTCQGAILPSSNNQTRIGNQYLYQFGLGRNIPSPQGSIWAWMIEVDGQYSEKNRINKSLDPNSGGNVIYITPSLWYSTKEITLQIGISLPVTQHLYGKQRKFDYAINFNSAWSFY